MINPANVIAKINKFCKNYFSESSFRLIQKNYLSYIVSGDNLSNAINRHHNSNKVVNVIKWFADFWLYLEIRFKQAEEKDFQVFISLSVFQGEQTDNAKLQLFRAEWDNFDNDEVHPQPHWHFYSDTWNAETFSEFIRTPNEGSDFINMLNEEKSKTIELNRVHFAMNGQWGTNGSHLHRIHDENTITNWLMGLLGHIKTQLEYAKQPD